MVNKMGFFAEAGPLQIFVFDHSTYPAKILKLNFRERKENAWEDSGSDESFCAMHSELSLFLSLGRNYEVRSILLIQLMLSLLISSQGTAQKGVPEAEVDQATRRVFQDGDGHGKEATFGKSKASMDHLFTQASKQWQRGQSLSLENRRCTHCEVASLPRLQLGCDQRHYQEARGSLPAATLLLLLSAC